MANKITKEMQFNTIRAILEAQGETALVEFVDNEIALVRKKNAKRSDKPTKAQAENAVFADAILAGMEAGKAMTVTEVQKAVPAVAELSNQRVSAIMRTLVQNGAVVRTEVKGKALFTLA